MKDAPAQPPSFRLHPQLAADTEAVAELPLSTVRLMNDSRFPWLILVPRRPEIRELHELSERDRAVLVEEVALASRVLARATGADKINVGALGNMVPQLHVHAVARFRNDEAWPGPVWGTGERRPYPAAELARTCASFAEALRSA
jgi:diadenosine tetraphosphate (Ap4A) HIT family hydrolase